MGEPQYLAMLLVWRLDCALNLKREGAHYMTTFEDTWRRLGKSKKFREEFALSLLKKMVPFQIKAIRKKRELSQPELAEKSHLTQGVISRAENLDYGNLTLNTIGRIAGGFDLAFIGKFVPFSEL